MIHADEHLFTSVVKQRETEIRAKEMELFAGHLGVIATLAAFLAEQSAEGLFLMPDNVAKSANNAWAPFFWAASALTLVLNALVLVVTTLSMIHGPTLAIRGPAGSMERAVVAMYAMRKCSMRLFFAGLLAFAAPDRVLVAAVPVPDGVVPPAAALGLDLPPAFLLLLDPLFFVKLPPLPAAFGVVTPLRGGVRGGVLPCGDRRAADAGGVVARDVG